jgi:hypothetical protein
LEVHVVHPPVQGAHVWYPWHMPMKPVLQKLPRGQSVFEEQRCPAPVALPRHV